MNFKQMKKVMLIVAFFSFIACKNETKKETRKNDPISKSSKDSLWDAPEYNSSEEKEKEELPILVGVKTKKDISSAPYNTWFASEYDFYTTDTKTLAEITPLLSDVNIKLFMGTWCEDSQREVPHFYKIINDSKFDEAKIELITVNRDKETPDHLEDGFDITNVPTFIFYKDGKELNRIVESPVESLEKDMLNILSGKAYKHTYAE